MAENNTPSKKTFAERAAAEPTELHKAFAKWIEEKTGVTPDLKSVQLAVTLRMEFQASEENQTALKERKAKAEVEAKKKAEARKAKLLAELAKLNGETTEPVADEAKPEEPAEAPKADAEPEAEADGENGAEAATEAVEEPKAEDKPKPVRRTRRTTAAKK